MRLQRNDERRAVILMVVLALLTLFAIVGITFVYYADSEATAARIAREAETQQRADMDPEQALAFILGQLIYDVNDDQYGIASGLRGHSLARTMYGYNYVTVGLPGSNNLLPFNGVGRLHYPSPLRYNPPPTLPNLPTGNGQLMVDDFALVNYTYFPVDGFLRDPERAGTRLNFAAPPNPNYIGGNAPYTYPDLNNFFLAAVKADGTVLSPSFHRKWLFNPNNNFNDMTNPNWTNQVGKYLTLRPRPIDHNGFPAPDDATGDVKNLVWGPGGNDSIWIDIGAPVMTAPDGTKYKMLVAPLILDLDGRINLNTAGNIVAFANNSTAPHVSNQGWGPWEVNLAKVLYGDPTNTEWINLFKGNVYGSVNVPGRYVVGNNSYTPTTAGSYATAPGSTFPLSSIAPPGVAPGGSYPHFYAPVDFNGLNETKPGTPSLQPSLPTGTNWFQTFPPGAYFNGGTFNNITENLNHPLLFDTLRGQLPNGISTRVFRPFEMEALLRPNNNYKTLPGQTSTNLLPPDTGSSALLSDLLRLCPYNFGPSAAGPNNTNPYPRYRNLVTTLSMDLGSPGVLPYWYSTNTRGKWSPVAPYLYPQYPIVASTTTNPTNPMLAPSGGAVTPFPTPGQAIGINPGTTPPPYNTEFGADWRAVSAALGRIKLNRPLPPYPHMGSGQMPPYGPPLVTWGQSYGSTPGTPAFTQYQYALTARMTLANDIYRRLLALTGITPAANPPTPTPAELAPRRWLAQLAVNIVDYIDEDDINTPFPFYTQQDTSGQPNLNLSTPLPPTQGGDDSFQNMGPLTGANPTYWVFGTELPKVVLNEALVEALNPDVTKNNDPSEQVNVWLELYNTMQAPPAGTTLQQQNLQQQDNYRIPFYMTLPGAGARGYSPYRVTLTPGLMHSQPTDPNALLPDATANVLGKSVSQPAAGITLPQSTTDADFLNVAQTIGGGTQAPATPPTTGVGIDPQLPGPPSGSGFLLIGPPKGLVPPYQDPFTAPPPNTIPANTPVVRTTSMQFVPNWVANNLNDERTLGLTVLLRRLANPFLPFNGDPNAGIQYNPYVTVDYLEHIPVRAAASFPYPTRGKRQPYAALTQLPPMATNALTVQPYSPVVDQAVNAMPPPQGGYVVNNVTNTFGTPNYPLPYSGHYDWLVHLDRQVISPMELLHVSGYQPYQLTQQFIVPQVTTTNNDNGQPGNMFRHYVPWLDTLPPPTPPATTANVAAPWWFDLSFTPAAPQSHRLHRLFEFLECGDRAYGVDGWGRIPGRVNINTVWDPEILRALCDANISLGANMNDSVIDQIFGFMMSSRSPAGSPGASDRPFLPLSIGFNQTGPQYPNNGINVAQDTILRLGAAAGGTTPQLLLFENPNDATITPANPPYYQHPYLQTQLLTKLYNNVSTRSNVFAVWLTIGFFEVTDTTTTPPKLGAEIGRSEGRQIRHRMFAIVDRTNLNVFQTTFTGPQPITVPQPPNSMPQTATVQFTPMNGSNPNTGALWSIGVGSTLVFEPGTDNEETVVLQSPPPNSPPGSFQATFYKSHQTGVTVIQRGNPGPWTTRYDPRLDPLVVPHYSIID